VAAKSSRRAIWSRIQAIDHFQPTIASTPRPRNRRRTATHPHIRVALALDVRPTNGQRMREKICPRRRPIRSIRSTKFPCKDLVPHGRLDHDSPRALYDYCSIRPTCPTTGANNGHPFQPADSWSTNPKPTRRRPDNTHNLLSPRAFRSAEPDRGGLDVSSKCESIFRAHVKSPDKTVFQSVRRRTAEHVLCRFNRRRYCAVVAVEHQPPGRRAAYIYGSPFNQATFFHRGPRRNDRNARASTFPRVGQPRRSPAQSRRSYLP